MFRFSRFLVPIFFVFLSLFLTFSCFAADSSESATFDETETTTFSVSESTSFEPTTLLVSETDQVVVSEPFFDNEDIIVNRLDLLCAILLFIVFVVSGGIVCYFFYCLLNKFLTF